jgi:hypothetical protein
VSRVVTRADRTRDVMAVLVLIAGFALYAYAWWGMRGLATKQLVIPKGIPAMRYFDTYWQMSRFAILIMIAGTAAIVWSCWSYSSRIDPAA